jgi:4-hydroxy-2-oxoheptanedioate aldolase
MDIKKNTFKAALKSGERAQIGLWLGLTDSICAEISAGAGFDWLLIDGEHAPNDVRSILAQLQAVAAYPVHPIVRPVSGDVQLIKQLLDIGAQTLLVPMVESADQAKQLVAATLSSGWDSRRRGCSRAGVSVEPCDELLARSQ